MLGSLHNALSEGMIGATSGPARRANVGQGLGVLNSSRTLAELEAAVASLWPDIIEATAD